MHFIITLSLILPSLCLAAIPVTVDQNVTAMVEDFKKGSGNIHKSSLKAKAQAYGSLGTAIQSPNEMGTVASMADWNGRKCLVFALEHDSSTYAQLSRKFRNRIKSLSDKKEKISEDELVIQDEKQDTLDNLLPPPTDTQFDFLADLDRYKAIAEQALVDMNGAVEFDNHEITYVNGCQSTLDLRYRRIFRGGLVRGNASFVYLRMNHDGKIIKVRAKWPVFKANPAVSALYSGRAKRSLDEVVSEARSYVENIPDISNSTAQRRPVKGSLDGLALAWILDTQNGKILITPGFSFISKVEYEGGVVFNPYQDVSLFDQLVK
ncbi:MAG: hypothetical protein JWP91_311 [Fibrobacteres bacterium]|nr:hypothetical protein [Fibrobacterota bacterium]